MQRIPHPATRSAQREALPHIDLPLCLCLKFLIPNKSHGMPTLTAIRDEQNTIARVTE